MEQSSHGYADWVKALEVGTTPHGNPVKWHLVKPGYSIPEEPKYWVGRPPEEKDGKLVMARHAGVVLPKNEDGEYPYIFTV